MDSLPLVSIICLCHNQKDFVESAIKSVFTQTYQNIQLIVVDDGSMDGSQEVIRELLKTNTDISFISLDDTIGNCAAFNRGLALANGDFIIDLAGDDILLPKRVEEGINDFINAPSEAGVHFSDAFLINAAGEMMDTFYPRNESGQLTEEIPQGDLYRKLVSRYFICAPTMMTKREVFEKLAGYDEQLSYEDFDFWIRSSRHYHYLFNPAPLVKKRELPNSLGKVQFAIRSRHLDSTLKVCRKIYDLNTTAEEYRALIKRCRYEIKQCVKTLNLGLIAKYRKLIKQSQRRLSSLSSMDK